MNEWIVKVRIFVWPTGCYVDMLQCVATSTDCKPDFHLQSTASNRNVYSTVRCVCHAQAHVHRTRCGWIAVIDKTFQLGLVVTTYRVSHCTLHLQQPTHTNVERVIMNSLFGACFVINNNRIDIDWCAYWVVESVHESEWNVARSCYCYRMCAMKFCGFFKSKRATNSQK